MRKQMGELPVKLPNVRIDDVLKVTYHFKQKPGKQSATGRVVGIHEREGRTIVVLESGFQFSVGEGVNPENPKLVIDTVENVTKIMGS